MIQQHSFQIMQNFECHSRICYVGNIRIIYLYIIELIRYKNTITDVHRSLS